MHGAVLIICTEWLRLAKSEVNDRSVHQIAPNRTEYSDIFCTDCIDRTERDGCFPPLDLCLLKSL